MRSPISLQREVLVNSKTDSKMEIYRKLSIIMILIRLVFRSSDALSMGAIYHYSAKNITLKAI